MMLLWYYFVTLNENFILSLSFSDVSGKLSRGYTNGKKFTEIDIKTPNTTLKISTRTLRIDGKKTIAWWQLKKVNISQGVLTASGGLKLDLGDDLYVTVSVYGIQSRRSRVKPFLSISVNSVNWAHAKPSGVVGEYCASACNRLHSVTFTSGQCRRLCFGRIHLCVCVLVRQQ